MNIFFWNVSICSYFRIEIRIGIDIVFQVSVKISNITCWKVLKPLRILFFVEFIRWKQKKTSIRQFLVSNIYLIKILFTIISLKKIKYFTTIYIIVDDIFSYFFICLIVLNLLFNSPSFSHISLSFILFSSCFNLSFLAAANSFCSRFSSFRFSARSLNSCSSPC